MYQFDFVFRIHDFDDQGEEHRLHKSGHAINKERAVECGAKLLVEYVARLLRCNPDQVAVKRIMLKSAWMNDDRCKRHRITATQLLEGMLRAGISTKGRNEQRIEERPPTYQRPNYGKPKRPNHGPRGRRR